MQNNNIDLSIIIVDYKSDVYLEKCLGSIAKKSNWEVIIVDNNVENIGYGAGLNKGVRSAKGKYLLFLNPDTVILDDAIEKMVNFMEKNNQIGILGPRLFNSEKKDRQLSFCRFPNLLTAFIVYSPLKNTFIGKKIWNSFTYGESERKNRNDRIIEVDEVSGAAMLVRKEVFERTGGFDENIFIYFEENDFCRRVQQMGYKIIFLPEAEIIHYGGKSTPEEKIANQYFRDSRKYYFKKHYGKVFAVIALNLIGIIEQAVTLIKSKKP